MSAFLRVFLVRALTSDKYSEKYFIIICLPKSVYKWSLKDKKRHGKPYLGDSFTDMFFLPDFFLFLMYIIGANMITNQIEIPTIFPKTRPT